MLGKKAAGYLNKQKVVNDKIMMARFYSKFMKLTVVVCYVSTKMRKRRRNFISSYREWSKKLLSMIY